MARLINLTIFLFCLLLGLVNNQLFSFMLKLIDDAHYVNQRIEVINQLGRFRSELEQHLNASFYASRGLELLVSSNASGKPILDVYGQQVALWAEKTSRELPYLRNIGISQGYVLSYVYPKEGNEKVLGYDYRDLPDQWPAVERAIKNHLPVVAGPLSLIQGGEGIICRIPLFTGVTKDNKGDFVGVVSMVLDYSELLRSAGFLEKEKKLLMAIRGRDGLGATGEVFQGGASVFDTGVIQTVSFLGGEWLLAAQPQQGWERESVYSYWLGWLGHLISIFIALVSYVAIKSVLIPERDK